MAKHRPTFVCVLWIAAVGPETTTKVWGLLQPDDVAAKLTVHRAATFGPDESLTVLNLPNIVRERG